MKTCVIFLLLLLIAQISLAQTNLTQKKTHHTVKNMGKPVPDLIGLLTVNPGVIHSPTSVTAIIDVIETKKVATSGVITVFLLKNTSFVDFKFDPTATSIGGNAVQNANWSLDSITNPNFYIFTSTNSIAGGALSTIGLTGSFTSQATGKFSLSLSIVKGSGGEVNSFNNTASTAVSFNQ